MMTAQHEHAETEQPAEQDVPQEELPEELPAKAWVTLALFAGFVVVTGTCLWRFVIN